METSSIGSAQAGKPSNVTQGSPAAITRHIVRLVEFALRRDMIAELDKEAAVNALLDLFRLSEPDQAAMDTAFDEPIPDSPTPLLEPLLDAAAELGLIPDDTVTYRDLFDARIMGLLMPRPSETAALFEALKKEKGVVAATDWFYRLNMDSNYIRMDRIRRNGYWLHPTAYGGLEITVNLSKPEKDPKEIALLKTLPQSNYPPCLLCKENVGYAGRPDHPARQNIRLLPVELQGERWFFQYSPYVYYNEHSIVLRGEHVPMRISRETFARLLDFVERFPHYFIGSNADLPIVGGSILNHDHFQAGRHVFPMEQADVDAWREHSQEPKVRGGIVKWPMSVLRLRSEDRDALLRTAGGVLDAWRGYSDAAAEVAAFSGETPHNTITPIARMRDNGEYELDLVLRNNRTSEEHPDGIFHPHRELHHIKKENIGLIEVMGLAVLPGRLQQELADIAELLTGAAAYDPAALADAAHPLAKHADWIAELVSAYGTAMAAEDAARLLQREVGDKFAAVLRDAGVYKETAPGRTSFERFLASAGF
ncbi:UDP-glucose--hexose-1-phosphate uridylyltransferase [Cohnella lubricantis]|uniref:Galactose-1-phosphate uridylyltransferase n=1 Tax=Cohnella lubricantis TaxID=2163172 RepID=A0A841TCS0_9BACL|nr:UDP-glucose--hexose-1-phosphate uridylyltransferase [Cohnella lubricantis]MBB6677976.1 UDP-glucose--hexose-1-phosphate uridylyltransferase [Cohnella lubricantis]MBP2119956.1 UDPglucose--hexose-1-phosphate uridylyltransferase [Cohnella lubricantis]